MAHSFNNLKKLKDLEYNVSAINFHHRKLFLFAEINNNSAYRIVSHLYALDKIDHKKPIELYINIEGGLCSAGVAIIETIQKIKSPVHTIITGEACSMGSLISVVGNKRFATRTAVWMAHDTYHWIEDYSVKVKDRADFIEKYENMLIKIYKKYTKLNDIELDKAKNGELWLFANDMLKKGIIDKIIN